VSDALCILRRDDALLGQHCRMGLARGNVLPVEVPVEIDRALISSMTGSLSEPKRPPHILLLMMRPLRFVRR
jgi:hypothetical protein